MGNAPHYPSARRDGLIDEIHGVLVADPYRWLEDRGSSETEAWLSAQADLFQEQRAAWTSNSYWRNRIETFLGSGFVTPPAWRRDRSFIVRRQPGQDHGILYCREADGTEIELVNPNSIDPDGLTTLDAWTPSRDGERLAYQLSLGGSEESAVFVMDVGTQTQIDGPIDRTRYSPIAWLPDGSAFYYVRRLPPDLVPAGEEQYHRRVWLHHIGADPSSDALVFGDGRKHTEYFGVAVSRDGKWLSVSASEGTAPRNDLWVADLETGSLAEPALTAVQVGIDANSSTYFGRDGRAYIFTDRDAQRGRVCVGEPQRLNYERWVTLIEEDRDAVLEGFAILDGAELDEPVMMVSWTRHAVAEVTVHDLATGRCIDRLDLPGLGTVGGFTIHPEGGHEAGFTYTDHTTIPRVLVYDRIKRSLEVFEYPPGFVVVPEISSTMHSYRSNDGTEVRLMVLAPAETGGRSGKPSQVRPTILYGYGGFGIPMAPAFSPSVLAWVEAGGVYVIACIRGGSEEGEWWHRDGMLGKKQNVFDDFTSAARWLIDNGWTDSDHLAISGGSNGGLLVGVAMTQNPDLFAGVHCSAPLLDMIRYEHFGLGETWNVEYGSASVKEEFEWLGAYSPYHYVAEDVAYPATLLTVFDRDTRVDPMHARKMCAALQHATTSDRPILLRTEADVGHGARSVSRSLGLSADVLSFLAAATGLSPETATTT